MAVPSQNIWDVGFSPFFFAILRLSDGYPCLFLLQLAFGAVWPKIAQKTTKKLEKPRNLWICAILGGFAIFSSILRLSDGFPFFLCFSSHLQQFGAKIEKNGQLGNVCDFYWQLPPFPREKVLVLRGGQDRYIEAPLGGGEM